MKWEKITFSELVEFPPKLSLEKNESYDNIPMDVVDGGIKYVQEINQRVYTGGGAKFGNGDTIFARITPCLENGKIAKVKGLEKGVGFGSTEFFVFRAKENIAEPDFIYYLAKTDIIRQPAIKSMVGASGRQRADKGVVEQIKVPKIPLPTQRRIASILSAYDDLIENNLKRIKLLEEKAFIRYKQIVKNEKMISVNKLEKIIQTIKRKPKILKSDYKESGVFPIIDQSTDFIGGYTNEKEAIYEDIPMIVFGDHTRILKYINFPFACGADGTQLVKPLNSNISILYLYYELISCNLSNYHYARHFKFLKEQLIKLPSEKVMIKYKNETDDIFNLIQILRSQNTKLREARDILLPRLMSGEIEV
jgi:type I restriction enzyme S subunit